MLLSIAKRVAIRYLGNSGDPELLEIAKWIEDAEEQAVNLILELLGQGLRSTGTVDKTTAAEILKVRRSGPQATTDPVSEALRDSSPYLAEYRRLAHTLTTLASWRRGLYVQGFIHRRECTSLWLFGAGRPPSFGVLQQPIDGRSFISLYSNEIEVYIMDAMAQGDLQAANAKLGNNYTAWKDSIDMSQLDRVENVYEDSVEIAKVVKRQKKTRSGTTEVLDRESVSIAILDRLSGIEAMLESLPLALEARDATLMALRSKTS